MYLNLNNHYEVLLYRTLSKNFYTDSGFLKFILRIYILKFTVEVTNIQIIINQV